MTLTREDLVDISKVTKILSNEDINIIIRNQEIVNELVKLRDTPNLPIETLIEKLINLTSDINE